MLGQYDQALADLTKAVEISPGDAETRFFRGAVYALTDEREKALADLTAALELGLDPELRSDAEELLEELSQ